VEWAKLIAKGSQIDETFQVTLRMQHGYMDPLGLMDFKILPESVLPSKITDEKFARQPVGSGPFRFAANDGEKCVFVANQHYGARENREGLPRIREIFLVKSVDPFQEFRTDPNFGMVFDLTSAKFKELKSAGLDATVKLRTLPNRRIYFLALNHRNSVMQNEHFRRGLANAIQRDEILKACFREGLEQPVPHRALNGPYPPGSWAADPSVLPYRTPFARDELTLAKANRATKVSLTLKYPDDDPAVARACELIKKQIQEADPTGLTIELLPKSPAELHHDVEIAHDYQLAYYSHDFPSEAFWLWPLFQHDATHENYLGYKDDELEGRMRQLMAHRDFKQWESLAHQIHQRCHEMVPFVPLWQLDTHVLIRNNLVWPHMNAINGIDPLAIFRDADQWVLGKE
jgi:ABC-type oligopeptide transport system substrate-binding subunit